MGIHVRWDDVAQTIIYCDFDEDWTLDDFHTMIDDIYNLANSVQHPVYMINDYTRSRVSPRQWLSTGSHIEKRQSPNTKVSVVVGASPFVKVMLNVAQKLFLRNMRIFSVDTRQQAYDIIGQNRQQKAA